MISFSSAMIFLFAAAVSVFTDKSPFVPAMPLSGTGDVGKAAGGGPCLLVVDLVLYFPVTATTMMIVNTPKTATAPEKMAAVTFRLDRFEELGDTAFLSFSLRRNSQ